MTALDAAGREIVETAARAELLVRRARELRSHAARACAAWAREAGAGTEDVEALVAGAVSRLEGERE